MQVVAMDFDGHILGPEARTDFGPWSFNHESELWVHSETRHTRKAHPVRQGRTAMTGVVELVNTTGKRLDKEGVSNIEDSFLCFYSLQPVPSHPHLPIHLLLFERLLA